MCRATEIVIVVRPPRHPRRLRPTPVVVEHGVGHITALGRFDEYETDPRCLGPVPVNRTLPARHVQPVYRIMAGVPPVPVMRVSIAKGRINDRRRRGIQKSLGLDLLRRRSTATAGQGRRGQNGQHQRYAHGLFLFQISARIIPTRMPDRPHKATAYFVDGENPPPSVGYMAI